jgi:cytolysin (calcineurin-like family phosphatase)
MDVPASSVDETLRTYWTSYSGYYLIVFPELVVVQLNRFGGDTKDRHEPGLDWLTRKLDAIYESNSVKVVVCQHYGWDWYSMCENPNGNGWACWHQGDRSALLAALKPYNVIACLTGHLHNPASNWFTTTVLGHTRSR